MNPYEQVAARYRRLARQARPTWLEPIHDGDLDDVVEVIRRKTSAGDVALRELVMVGRRDPDALTVVLHALIPSLQARLGRTVTEEYRIDVLTDLTFVLLDGSLDGSGLAHRLVNRAHNRSYKAALRTHTRGEVNLMTVTPCDPNHFVRHAGSAGDFATTVSRRVDLARFHAAVASAIAGGLLTESEWTAYREHRLRRAIDDGAPVCDGHQRTTAHRTARKLEPIVASRLHAA